ncbi:hypothetical protein [Roseomonas genomospecies 6]|uniref:hypothetical protein n=1 Tax=Roseomonas genomospecies 6 TaxID=214106 RepID=UPI00142EA116|nr:hypothetical protein [Roseomonas genomospecies 6]
MAAATASSKNRVAAAVFRQEGQQVVHPAERGGIDQGAACAALLDQTGVGQLRQMEGQRGRRLEFHISVMMEASKCAWAFK